MTSADLAAEAYQTVASQTYAQLAGSEDGWQNRLLQQARARKLLTSDYGGVDTAWGGEVSDDTMILECWMELLHP